MQKLIRVTAIIALALLCLSLLLLLVSIPCQRVLAAKVLRSPQEAISFLPVFPLAFFINCFLLTGCAILAVVFGGNQKGGIWLEIIVFILVALALPLLNTVLANVQNVMIANVRGSSYIVANTIANQIANMCMGPGNLGRSLILVVCGMSIVYKRMSKKLAKVTE